jgi:hypothetical protein
MARRLGPATESSLQMEPVSLQSQLLMFGLVVVLPLLLVMVLPLAGGEVPLPPAGIAGGNPVLLRVYAALGVLVFLSAVFFLQRWRMQRQRLLADASGLDVTTGFIRRRLAWTQLRMDQARVVSLGERPEVKPVFKSRGMRLPGFRSGWFRTRTLGRQLVATAGGDRVLWLPTTQGYDLLLQPRNPQAALVRLRELSAMATPAGRG